MTDRENCPLRHENGNCWTIGGFCTAVNDSICAGLHNAYNSGYTKGLTAQRWIPVSERLPTVEDADEYGRVWAFNKHDGYSRVWDWDCVAEYPVDFIYWIPLPQPPQDDNVWERKFLGKWVGLHESN